MNIDELLEAERARGGFSRVERDAMWRGIKASIGVAGAAGVVGAGAATATAKAAATKSAGAAGTATLAKWKLAGLLSAVAIGGAGAGAAAHARFAPPKIVEVERAAPAVAAAGTSASEAAASATAPSPEAPTAVASAPATAAHARTPARPAAAPTGAAKDPSLARERTLLDMGRTALSRGDASGALSSLDTHAREFPSSQLAEEREVLAIQALAAAGRTGDARKRAAAFRARFVNSPLRPIVDEATP